MKVKTIKINHVLFLIQCLDQRLSHFVVELILLQMNAFNMLNL